MVSKADESAGFYKLQNGMSVEIGLLTVTARNRFVKKI